MGLEHEAFMQIIIDGPLTDACIEWPYALAGTGHAMYTIYPDGKVKRRQAARFILERVVGSRPSPKHFALHHCDNPPCINPQHLYWGTKQQNALDRDRRGRRDINGARNPNVRLSTENLARARALHREGVTTAEIARTFGMSWSGMDHALRNRST